MASENIREGADVRRIVANALSDPGQRVARKRIPVERGFPELEPLHEWQLRAIETVLAPLDALGARLWREEAWKCYVASGADPDGADARHLNPGEALAAVEELAEEYTRAIRAMPMAADNTMRLPRAGVAEMARALLAIYDAAEHDSDAGLFNVVRTTEVELLPRDALEPLAGAEGMDAAEVIARAQWDFLRRRSPLLKPFDETDQEARDAQYALARATVDALAAQGVDL